MQKLLGVQIQAVLGARLQAIKYNRTCEIVESGELTNRPAFGGPCLVRCKTGL